MSTQTEEHATPTATSGASFGAAVRDSINRVAWEMERELIPPGDQASLRRDSAGTAFWKIAVSHLEPAGLLRGSDRASSLETERRWRAILAGLACSRGLHQPGRRLGVALAEADVAEMRVLRLARAHGEALLASVRAVTHQLVSKGHPVDWSDLAELILSDGASWEEEVRRRLALDYYRTLGRHTRGAEKEES